MTDPFEPGQYPPPPPGYPPPPPPPPESQWLPGVPPPGMGMAAGRLANYGERLGGWLIDWILLVAVVVLLIFLTHSFHHTHTYVVTNGGSIRTSGYYVGPAGISLQALVVIVYGTIFCGGARGQTLGMRVAGTRVVNEVGAGTIGYPRALGRAAFEYLMAIVFFIPWVIDMLFPLWDPKNQTLHDKVTRTVVVKV